jgi:hypothetical protein
MIWPAIWVNFETYLSPYLWNYLNKLSLNSFKPLITQTLWTNYILPKCVSFFHKLNPILVYLAIYSIAIYFHQAKHTVFPPFLILVISLIICNLFKKHKEVSYTLYFIYLKNFIYPISQRHEIFITDIHSFPVFKWEKCKRHIARQQRF